MAIQSQSVLCRRLGETYYQAVLQSRDSIEMQIDWLADILDYLDPEDTKTNKIHRAYLDDATPETILKFFAMKEKDNGPILGQP